MPQSEKDAVQGVADVEQQPILSLQDLLDAESEVLRRVGRDYDTERAMAGHNSMSTGHRMSGTHTSHTSAKVETPLEE